MQCEMHSFWAKVRLFFTSNTDLSLTVQTSWPVMSLEVVQVYPSQQIPVGHLREMTIACAGLYQTA